MKHVRKRGNPATIPPMSTADNSHGDLAMDPDDARTLADTLYQANRAWRDTSEVWKRQAEELHAPLRAMAEQYQALHGGAVAVAEQLVGFKTAVNLQLDGLRSGFEAIHSLVDGPRRLAEAFQDLVKPVHLTFVALKVDLNPMLGAIRTLSASGVLDLWKAEMPRQYGETELSLEETSSANTQVIDVPPAQPAAPASPHVPAVIGLAIDLTLDDTPYLQILPADALLLDHRVALQGDGDTMLYFRSELGWFPERVKPQVIILLRELWNLRLSAAAMPYQRLIDLGKLVSGSDSLRVGSSSASNCILTVRRLCRKHFGDEFAILQKSAGRWGLNPHLTHWKEGPKYRFGVHRNVHQCSSGTGRKSLAELKKNEMEG